MRYYSANDINSMESRFRSNLINNISGYKPVNLIGTKSLSGNTNLAIFSSVVHLGANPPLLGFIMRPETVQRHTLENIRETKYYTINHVHIEFLDKAHHTSAKYNKYISEFEVCGLTPFYHNEFSAPFVKESKVQIGLQFLNELLIEENGTILIIGKIECINLAEEMIRPSGDLDLNLVDDVCISGLSTYHTVTELKQYLYARPKSDLAL